MNHQLLQEQLLDERDLLIEKHIHLVIHLAKKIRQKFSLSIEIEDLIGYGQIGLVKASKRFDPTLGNAFSTFAYYYINGEIYDGLRKMGFISRSKKLRFYSQANEVLTTEISNQTPDIHHFPIDAEIEQIENCIDDLITVYFLSLDDDDAKELADENAFDESDYERFELRDLIQESMSEIDSKNRELLKQIYFDQISMTEIANQKGVSKSWISQQHAQAISQLKEVLRKKGIFDSS